jgi:hypothetical protein
MNWSLAIAGKFLLGDTCARACLIFAERMSRSLADHIFSVAELAMEPNERTQDAVGESHVLDIARRGRNQRIPIFPSKLIPSIHAGCADSSRASVRIRMLSIVIDMRVIGELV